VEKTFSELNLKMPRVLRIINRFNLGGPTFNAAYLTRYLQPEFETKLIGGLKDESEDSSEFVVQNLGVDYLIIEHMRRSINLRKDWKAYLQILKIIRSFKPDIVHTHASKAGFLGRMAAIRLKVPVIVHTFHGHVFHSYFGKLKSAIFKSLERYLARRSSMIIAISDEQKRELVEQHQICSAEKMTVIRLGFDLNKFRDNMQVKRAWFRSYYQLQDNEVAIGIVGRLVPIKNHKLFLQAINEVLKHSKVPVKAFIIGDGSAKQQVKDDAHSLALSYTELSGTDVFLAGKEDETTDDLPNPSTVIFTSWIREIDYAYAGLDLVCLTSLNEGTPVSLIEAQASGKAVVSTKVGGVENIIEHGKTGLLSELSLSEFSKYLIQLVESAEDRKSMGSEGINRVLKTYHYNRLADDTRQLYTNLLASDK
jgi:glycosyltransferase involved in cell wall biosynthesis